MGSHSWCGTVTVTSARMRSQCGGRNTLKREVTNLQAAFSRNRLENRNDFYLKSILLYQLAHLQVRDGYVSVSWQHQPSGSRRVLAYRFFSGALWKTKNQPNNKKPLSHFTEK